MIFKVIIKETTPNESLINKIILTYELQNQTNAYILIVVKIVWRNIFYLDIAGKWGR